MADRNIKKWQRVCDASQDIVPVCMCVCEFVCKRAGTGEWGGGSRHDLYYILHNVILNKKSAMLCLYVCVMVRW